MDELTQLAQSGWTEQKEAAEHQLETQHLLAAINDATTAILAASNLISATIKHHQPDVTVLNPTESVRTPDVDRVVTAIEHLSEIEAKEQDLSPIVDNLKALIPALEAIPKAIDIPEPNESVTITNMAELTVILDDIKLSLKAALERPQPAPQVTVEPTPVTVQEKETDLTPLLEAITSGNQHVIDAISAIPTDDDTEVIAASKETTSAIQNLRFPIPNFIVDPTIKYRPADLDNTGNVRYFGFTDVSGAWYIMKEDVTSNPTSVRYCRGDTGYTTVWGVRASQTYYYFHEVF